MKARLSIIAFAQIAVVAMLLSVAAASGLAWLAGASPLDAVTALAWGSVFTRHGLEATLMQATPLILTGLAILLAFRSGVFNIGAEGQFLLGALAATVVGTQLPPFPGQALVALAAGALAGGFWAQIAVFYRLTRGVGEVITTIMLNFIALYLISWAVSGPLQETSGDYPQSDPLAEGARLWTFGDGDSLHAGIIVALIMTVLVGVLVKQTPLGLRLRAAGLNPVSARLAGFPVTRDIVLAFTLSGALAGLAGAVEVTGLTGRLFARIGSGYGYTAIAVALLGGLQPLGVLAAALFFGALGAGAATMERTADVSAVVAVAIQGAALLGLAIVAALHRGWLPGFAAAESSEAEDAG
jgi:simple sugar transport system permease protein